MIGGNILGNPTLMQRCAQSGGHIAVHTWSHGYMTSLSNEDVLSELGWTMQLIADLNGGRIPRYWRPPFGDVDNRVRAIAKGVFGLETVTWNRGELKPFLHLQYSQQRVLQMPRGLWVDIADSGDWAIGTNPQYTHESVLADMTGWFTGPKSPGINSLEHEIKDTEVDSFIAAFPVGRSNGWDIRSIPDAFGQPWYLNAESNEASVSPRSIAQGIFTGSGASSASTSASASVSMTTSASASSSASASTAAPSSSASGAASSGAANAPTASGAGNGSNGAGQLVVGLGSFWALASAIITAFVL